MNTDSFKQRQLLFQGGGNTANTQQKARTSVPAVNKDFLVNKFNSANNNNSNKNNAPDKSFQKKNTTNSILKIANQMENKKKNTNDEFNKRKSVQIEDKIDLNVSKEKSSKPNLNSSNNSKPNLNVSKDNSAKPNLNTSKENNSKPNIPKEDNLSINLNIEKEKSDIKKENDINSIKKEIEKKIERKGSENKDLKKEAEKKIERKGSENKDIKKEIEKKDEKKDKGKDNTKEVKKNKIEEIKKQMEKGKENKKENELKTSKKDDKNNENKKDNIINEISKKMEKESKKEGDISSRKESTNAIKVIKNENKNNDIIKDSNINKDKDKDNKEKDKDKENNSIKNNLFMNNFKNSPSSNVINNKDFKGPKMNLNQEKKPEKSKFDKIYEHIYKDENHNHNEDNKKDSNKNVNLKTLSDLEIDNFKDFNEEDYSIRRYDKYTIDKGKIFFKYRYLKNKYTQINETIQRLSNVNANNINNNNRNTSFNANKFLFSNNINNNNINNQNRNTINIDNKFKLSSNIHLSFFIKNPSSQCLNSIDKDSELRHYHSQFLQLTEKSIISFNLKKFEESYLYLFSNNIIKNLEEFGEFLLVVNGFDKFVIGEFLCGSLAPNDKKEVSRSFINGIKMNYDEINFLECFRFFMKRFYLPKDANLILEIMNTFSEIYFEYNKKNTDFVTIFKNANNIYLLISTLLAVNTMFTRKDIKNLNIIKKEEFVTMNKDIPENVIINIYEQLEKNPFLIDNENYNENIYKRMSALVKEKISSRKNDDDDTFLSKSSTFNEKMSVAPKKVDEKPKIIAEEDSDEEYDSIFDLDLSSKKAKSNMGTGSRPFMRSSFSLTKNLYSFTKQDQDILSKTQKFYKLVGNGVLHEREFLVYDNFTKLIWGKNVDESKIKGNLHYILITDIFNVFNGIEHSDNIKKYIKSNPKEAKEKNNFITIISNKKELNIKSDSLQTALLWYKALKSLVLKTKNENLKKSTKALNEINTQFKLKLDELWKDFILPKWNVYGNYILLKLKKRNKIQVEKEVNTPKKNIDTIIKDTENDKNLEYSDFFEFFYLGLPTFCRGTIWKILIGNTCYITESLYENYLSQVEPQNFNTFDIKYHEDINTIFNHEFNINQMISDIIKTKDFFLSELINLSIDQEQIMNESYNILRIFFLIRNDLVYKKSIVPLIFVFLMVEDNEYNAFCNLYNLICNSDIIKFYIGDEDYIKKNVAFFSDLVKKYLPKLHQHFLNLEIEHELYFIPWFSEIFSSSMNYKLLLRVLDLYLINGEYILFQIALSILAVQEDDLLDLAISEIFKILKKLSSKYKEDFFLEKMKSFDCIKEEYNKWKNENELGIQKLQLFQAIFNDDK